MDKKSFLIFVIFLIILLMVFWNYYSAPDSREEGGRIVDDTCANVQYKINYCYFNRENGELNYSVEVVKGEPYESYVRLMERSSLKSVFFNISNENRLVIGNYSVMNPPNVFPRSAIPLNSSIYQFAVQGFARYVSGKWPRTESVSLGCQHSFISVNCTLVN